jgi:hypothetical protein
MNKETTQYTSEEISKMSFNQWVAAGKPVRPFAERYGVTKEQVQAKLDSLIVGNIYEDKHDVYMYEGGQRSHLRNRIACNGHTPLTDHKGEFVNVDTILEVFPSKVTKKEFDNYYKGTSEAMQEWCDKNGSD